MTVKQKCFYDSLLQNPPYRKNGTPNMGCRTYEIFWKSFQGIPARICGASRGSNIYIAWMAGREYRKRNQTLSINLLGYFE